MDKAAKTIQKAYRHHTELLQLQQTQQQQLKAVKLIQKSYKRRIKRVKPHKELEAAQTLWDQLNATKTKPNKKQREQLERPLRQVFANSSSLGPNAPKNKKAFTQFIFKYYTSQLWNKIETRPIEDEHIHNQFQAKEFALDLLRSFFEAESIDDITASINEAEQELSGKIEKGAFSKTELPEGTLIPYVGRHLPKDSFLSLSRQREYIANRSDGTSIVGSEKPAGALLGSLLNDSVDASTLALLDLIDNDGSDDSAENNAILLLVSSVMLLAQQKPQFQFVEDGSLTYLRADEDIPADQQVFVYYGPRYWIDKPLSEQYHFNGDLLGYLKLCDELKALLEDPSLPQKHRMFTPSNIENIKLIFAQELQVSQGEKPSSDIRRVATALAENPADMENVPILPNALQTYTQIAMPGFLDLYRAVIDIADSILDPDSVAYPEIRRKVLTTKMKENIATLNMSIARASTDSARKIMESRLQNMVVAHIFRQVLSDLDHATFSGDISLVRALAEHGCLKLPNGDDAVDYFSRHPRCKNPEYLPTT